MLPNALFELKLLSTNVQQLFISKSVLSVGANRVIFDIGLIYCMNMTKFLNASK